VVVVVSPHKKQLERDTQTMEEGNHYTEKEVEKKNASPRHYSRHYSPRTKNNKIKGDTS